MQNFIIRITQENNTLINHEKIGCFIIPDTFSAQFIADFIAQAHLNGKLVLTQGANAVSVCKQYQADGVVIDTTKESAPQKTVLSIREQLPHAFIGAICRNRRHEAMLVSESEPDFVIFKVWKDGLENNRELLTWYSELFLLQCAAQIEEDLDFSSLPADFIILNDKQYIS